MGRKKKKPSEKRSEYVRVMLTPNEKASIEKAAIAVGADVSTWMRSKALEAVREGA